MFQNLNLERYALNDSECELIVEDRLSVGNTARPGLEVAIEDAQKAFLRQSVSLMGTGVGIGSHTVPKMEKCNSRFTCDRQVCGQSRSQTL